MRKGTFRWSIIHKKMAKDSLEIAFMNKRQYALAKDQYSATDNDNFLAFAIALRDRIVERWIATQQRYHKQNVKRVYYLSMEFLIGRLFGNNMLNLGLWDETYEAAKELGFDLDKIRDLESDAGLGNGGLGRLAACFLDSMATLGIPAHGYGIRYDYGIFNQKIENGYQIEHPDEWLRYGNPWEFARPEYTVKVKFGGRLQLIKSAAGKERKNWIDTEDVLAVPYDVPVIGFENDVVNTLRLWSASSTEEFDLTYFNDGDYERAIYNKMFSENISKVLYPNDNVRQGRELRLKQEYFFTAAAISDILRRFKSENTDITKLSDKISIQLNDTHPSLAIIELMRLLIDNEGLDWETAWDVTTKVFAYTNHTVMPEALERWSFELMERLLPRHLEIICDINKRFIEKTALTVPGDKNFLKRVSIIEESGTKFIRMANLSIIASHSTNGVSKLHTKLIKEGLFNDFYRLYPERFNNKTNGITQRRWLRKSNVNLSKLITNTIGKNWIKDLYQLADLLKHKDDASFNKKWQSIKRENKISLAGYIKDTKGIIIDQNSIFDVQVKRFHEYKRQILFAFYIIREYLKLKNDKNAFIFPRTFLIGGKSAPGYFMAKRIIKFINNIAHIIDNDKDIRGRLKLVFLENYRVSLAERIFPASDLSEQISTAGCEASGTGCMKFMLNGALTIGTYDGANIEMAEEVGKENMFLFGLNEAQIIELRKKGYNPKEYINRSPVLKEIFKLIAANLFSPFEQDIFKVIYDDLTNNDYFCVCADFDAYCETQDAVSSAYQNQKEWTKKAIINLAKSGKFSSDRAVREYAKDIWNIKCG